MKDLKGFMFSNFPFTGVDFQFPCDQDYSLCASLVILVLLEEDRYAHEVMIDLI